VFLGFDRIKTFNLEVMNMLHALHLGTSGAIYRSSSLLPCTKIRFFLTFAFFSKLFRSKNKIGGIMLLICALHLGSDAVKGAKVKILFDLP